MANWKLVILTGLAALLAMGSFAFADTYSYDTLGRLIGVTFVDGSSIAYSYDSAGNRITVTQTAP